MIILKIIGVVLLIAVAWSLFLVVFTVRKEEIFENGE